MSSTQTYHLLVSGYRPNFSYLSFEPSTAKIKVLKDSPAPSKAGWLEQSITTPGVYYSLKEDPEDGEAVSIKVDEEGTVEITGRRKTNGAPAHSKLREKLYLGYMLMIAASSRHERWIWYHCSQRELLLSGVGVIPQLRTNSTKAERSYISP
jgi:hypothetical protein